jgi:hypothetical protein
MPNFELWSSCRKWAMCVSYLKCNDLLCKAMSFFILAIFIAKVLKYFPCQHDLHGCVTDRIIPRQIEKFQDWFFYSESSDCTGPTIFYSESGDCTGPTIFNSESDDFTGPTIFNSESDDSTGPTIFSFSK